MYNTSRKKNLCISGPVQFKPMLLSGQLYFIFQITGLLQMNKSLKNQRWGNVCWESLDSCGKQVKPSGITFPTSYFLSTLFSAMQ